MWWNIDSAPADLYSQDTLDRMVQNSGIIIYRVDLTVQDYSNSGGYTGVWVFRPVEGISGYNATNDWVNIVNASLSSESGRTSMGSADLRKGLSDGALTFSNGENSGIVISEVGSAAGDTVSFRITYPDLTDADLWSNTDFPSGGGSAFQDITMAAIDGKLLAVEFNGSALTAYRQDDSGWTKISSALSASNYGGCMRLLSLNGKTFLLYTDYASGLVVPQRSLASGTWTQVTTLSANASYFDVAEIGGTIYVSELQGDCGENANLAVFDGLTLTDLGTYYTSSFANGGQRIVELDGSPCIFVRDAVGNALLGFRYSGNSFIKITDGRLSVSAFVAAVCNGIVYIASVDPVDSCLQISTFDITSWTTTKTEIDSAEATLTMVAGKVYVLASPSSGDGNFRMYAFADDDIRQEGDTAIDAASSAFTALTMDNRIYLSYVRMTDKVSIIKTKTAYGTSSGGSGSESTTTVGTDLESALISNDKTGIVVTIDGIVLVENQNYTVTAIDDTAIITGLGDYTGTVTMNFTDTCTRSSYRFAVHTAVTDPAIDSTCTEAGLTADTHCSVCGAVL